jgi:hypothetical protein
LHERAPHSKRDGDRAAIIRCAAATADKIGEANVHERSKRARFGSLPLRLHQHDAARQALAKRFGEARLFRLRGAER